MIVPGIEGNYIMKFANYFGVRDSKSGKAEVSKQKRDEISKEMIEFTQNYKKWFTLADDRLKNAVVDGKITRTAYNTFIDRQVKIAENIKYIFDNFLIGNIYFNFKEFEKQYIKDYATEKVFKMWEEMEYYTKQVKI